MPILAASGDSFIEISVTLGAWVLNFVATLAGLFISLFLLISHDDLQSSFIEPVELSNNLNSVSKTFSDNNVVHALRLSVFPGVLDSDSTVRTLVLKVL